MATKRHGRGLNTLRLRSCDRNSVTQTRDLIVTSMSYAANAQPVAVTGRCLATWDQACYHYSSAIKNNPSWSTLTCPQAAATTTYRQNADATSTWFNEHKQSWKEKADRKYQRACDMDEYPPAYLLDKSDDAFKFAGIDRRGQRVRYVPDSNNRGAASMWAVICLSGSLEQMTDAELWNAIKRGTNKQSTFPARDKEVMMLDIVVGYRPEFSMVYEHERNPKPDAGLASNPCLPADLAKGDYGFALLKLDEWYDKNPSGPKGPGPRWDYSRDYKKGVNGD